MFRLSDLEKSVEELQKEASVSHKLAPVQDLEEKAALIRKLGETLTELKSQSPHSRHTTSRHSLACLHARRDTHHVLNPHVNNMQSLQARFAHKQTALNTQIGAQTHLVRIHTHTHASTTNTLPDF